MFLYSVFSSKNTLCKYQFCCFHNGINSVVYHCTLSLYIQRSSHTDYIPYTYIYNEYIIHTPDIYKNCSIVNGSIQVIFCLYYNLGSLKFSKNKILNVSTKMNKEAFPEALKNTLMLRERPKNNFMTIEISFN